MTSAPAISYMSLSQLAERIGAAIRTSFRQETYWVLADVIDHKFYEEKGYHMFCLVEKDEENHAVKAKIPAVAWRQGGAASIAAFESATGQTFQSNIHILAEVSVQYQPAYGLKLELHEVDPTYTIGMLEQQRRETLHKLVTLCPDYISRVGDEYHTRNKSLPHARVIQRVAVVTASGAAGFKDFKDTIEHNRFGYRITLDTWFAAVQGKANAEGVCKRLIDIYNSGIAYDAVVIIRGGGSQSDLLLFEQFVLARAVAKFPIPVITGIGHHINQSIVDLMAHTAVKTPSIAAEFIISHNHSFEEAVLQMQQGIVIRTQQLFAREQHELSVLRSAVVSSGHHLLAAAREALVEEYQVLVNSGRKLLYDHQAFLRDAGGKLVVRPKIITAARHCDVDNMAAQLKRASMRLLTQQAAQVVHFAALTKALNPVNILRRGFTVVYRDGEIITNAENLGPADQISIRFYEQKVTAEVTTKTDLDEGLANL